MRVITLNANGIRSAARRGFFEWAQTQEPDVVCVQETRAQERELPPEANWPTAWERNLGWRIDYHMIAPGLTACVRGASIHKETRFSDRVPLTIDYDIETLAGQDA